MRTAILTLLFVFCSTASSFAAAVNPSLKNPSQSKKKISSGQNDIVVDPSIQPPTTDGSYDELTFDQCGGIPSDTSDLKRISIGKLILRLPSVCSSPSANIENFENPAQKILLTLSPAPSSPVVATAMSLGSSYLTDIPAIFGNPGRINIECAEQTSYCAYALFDCRRSDGLELCIHGVVVGNPEQLPVGSIDQRGNGASPSVSSGCALEAEASSWQTFWLLASILGILLALMIRKSYARS